jgi:transcriptional regulator with XRE-family HTH domain
MKQRYQPSEPQGHTASTGYGVLDRLLGGIYWGDNVVWELSSGSTTDQIDAALLRAAEGRQPIAYVTMSRPPSQVRDALGLPDLEVLDGREIPTPHDLIALMTGWCRRHGAGAVLVIDSLTHVRTRFGEAVAGSVFVRTCPMLLRLGAVAYWSLDLRGSRKLRERVRAITQCVIDVELDRLRVVKAEGRPWWVAGSVLRYTVRDGDLDLEPAPSLRLGPALRAIREQRRLSQTDIARMAGVSPSAVSQAEQGRRGLSLETLLLLSERLNTSLDSLLRGEPEPPYRLGRRATELGPGGGATVLLDDRTAGLRAQLVQLAPGATGQNDFQARGVELVAISTGLVQILTTGGNPVVREGEVLLADGGAITGWRNLGEDEASFFVVLRD